MVFFSGSSRFTCCRGIEATACFAPSLVTSTCRAPNEQAKAAVRHALRGVQSALEPWEARHMYLNFSDERKDVRRLFPFDVYRRLAVAKARWDVGELFRSNHPIPPATIVSRRPRRPRRSLVRRAPGRAARPVRAAR